jgi:hypothetical protein
MLSRDRLRQPGADQLTIEPSRQAPLIGKGLKEGIKLAAASFPGGRTDRQAAAPERASSVVAKAIGRDRMREIGREQGRYPPGCRCRIEEVM